MNPRAARILLAADRDGEDFADGLTQARAFAAADPPEPEWPAAVAEFEFRTGRRKAAEPSSSALAATGDLDSMLAAADVYARLKRFDAAAQIAPRRDDEVSRELRGAVPSGLQPRAGRQPGRGGEASSWSSSRNVPTTPRRRTTWATCGRTRACELERAKELLERAVAREPRNAAYLDSLGWVYFRLGASTWPRRTSAKRTSRADDPTIVEHLGDLEMQQGDIADAIRNWEKALELKHEEPERVRDKLRARAPPSRSGEPAPRRFPPPPRSSFSSACAARTRRAALHAGVRGPEGRDALAACAAAADRAAPPSGIAPALRRAHVSGGRDPRFPARSPSTYDGREVERASLTGPFGTSIAEYSAGPVTGEDRQRPRRRSGGLRAVLAGAWPGTPSGVDGCDGDECRRGLERSELGRVRRGRPPRRRLRSLVIEATLGRSSIDLRGEAEPWPERIAPADEDARDGA